MFSALFSLLSFAQNNAEITGVVIDSRTQESLESVVVELEGTPLLTTTDAAGQFTLSEVPAGDYILLVEAIGYITKSYPLTIAQGVTVTLDTILLETDVTQDLTDNLITLTENDLSDDETGADVTSGLLQATRDIFLSRAAFDFGQAFFRVRGYDSKEADVLINGVPMNKMFNGRPQWNNWGGLNDVVRNQELSAGLTASDYTFGGVFGSTNINTKSSEFRPGLRLSGSASNRTYGGRLMATYSSGLMDNGFAFTVSGSRRWAEEGYIDGTIYDAFAMFGSVDYKFNDKHLINATAFFSPNRRGSSTAITEEVFNLVGRRYNPNWGFQNGEQRNSRVREIEEPVFMLNHFFEGEKTTLKTSIAYQKGRVGRGRVQNNNARNPRPDDFRNLPSFYINDDPANPDFVNAEIARQNFIANPQLDWDFLYQSNLREGSDGESVYVQYDDVNADTQLTFNSIFSNLVNDNLKLNAGLTFRNLETENYGELNDLLGGQFYRDIDPFTNTANNAGGNPIRREGDRFLYNYVIDANEFDLFGQAQFTYSKVDFFVGANVNYTGYQREGLFANEQFPNNSKGKSDKLTFISGGIKGGFNYKISGKHFVTGNAAYFTQAPTLRNTFANARVSNDIVPNVREERVTSFDLSYIVRTPIVKARLTGYYSQFDNGTEVNFFFTNGLNLPPGIVDVQGESLTADFVSEATVGIDRQHIGAELGIEAQITPTVKLTGAAALGQFTFSDNAEVFLSSDDIPTLSIGTSLIKDYKVAQGPQQAYSLGIEYRDPNFWWVGLTGNYLSNNYTDISPILRTQNFVINPDDPDGFPFPDATEENVRELLRQDSLDDFFLVNAIGGKSWRYKGKYISLFASVNNVLNETFRTGGFEQGRTGNFQQLRDDRANGNPSFGPRYFYGFGRTYFINLAVSF